MVRSVDWIQTPIPPFPSCVTLGELLDSFCLFSHKKDMDNVSIYLIGLLGRAWHVVSGGCVGYQQYIWQEEGTQEA